MIGAFNTYEKFMNKSGKKKKIANCIQKYQSVYDIFFLLFFIMLIYV